MKVLYFVRHGQSEWNASGRMQGRRNSDLSALGREQAEAHGRLLASVEIESLIASPLARARQTAEIIERYVGCGIAYDERIVEWDCGDWSGRLRTDIERLWPDEWAALQADRYYYRGPGCENYPDMIARAAPFVDEILAAPARRIAIVSHGVIGRIMIGIALRMTPAEMIAFAQPNDIVYRVRLGTGASTPRSIDRYEAGAGPFAGIHGHVAAETA